MRSIQYIVTSVNIKYHISSFQRALINMPSEAALKTVFWFKVKAGAGVNPQRYASMSRTCNENPTQIVGQKTLLR